MDRIGMIIKILKNEAEAYQKQADDLRRRLPPHTAGELAAYMAGQNDGIAFGYRQALGEIEKIYTKKPCCTGDNIQTFGPNETIQTPMSVCMVCGSIQQ